MKAILNRLKEPSTAAGAAGVCLALAVGADIFGVPGALVSLLIVGAVVLGAVAIGLPERIKDRFG